ncbi:hypothetical protein K7X08_025942 [Anisodus acutangulus]|uniref:E3 ubiquitin-protein ligase LIN-1 n=1 Tax=Anisodus acutangulus TaxID=402998 RepID=A0A9Q1N1K4_9SOLA|nr:hypothetical protein K7X08_025942 [Anisodus acutangulus]
MSVVKETKNESGEGRSSTRSDEKAEGKRLSFEKYTQATTKCLNNSTKILPGCPSFRDNYQKHTEQPETSYNRSTRSSVTNKSYDASTSLRKSEIEHNAAIPALDEVAIQAVISIMNGHIKNFLLDEDFRTSLRHNSFASLNFSGFEEGLNTESKIIATLEQAIETVERAAENCANEKELKKVSVQLSVITGLNSNELRDRFTSGIPNSKLVACAHLYLSVIYKIQKKDRIAANHLLQVFCDLPFQARTNLLPDLWDRIFLHHLSHLKVWYDLEANFLGDLHNKSSKLKLLDKLYNENLDNGTYQFALYYKEWLTDGADIPLVPSIQISSISVPREGSFSNSAHLSSGVGGFSPQPVVIKKLYDEVFRHSHKLGAKSKEHQEESYEISVRRPARFASEVIKCIDQDVEAGATVVSADTEMPNTYRDDVVDAMSVALESSLSDERSREIRCKALLILGGHFLFSGKIMTEDWILKQAGFLEGFRVEYLDEKEYNVPVDATVITMEDDEEEAREKWLLNASALLIGSGKRSFVEALSKCLGSENSKMVRICLTTVAWLSSALASLNDSEFELSAFLAIITQLIECLQHGDLVEHKVLASLSLLNFSKIQG